MQRFGTAPEVEHILKILLFAPAEKQEAMRNLLDENSVTGKWSLTPMRTSSLLSSNLGEILAQELRKQKIMVRITHVVSRWLRFYNVLCTRE